jgi:RNA recognition motif-containing protein
VPPTIGVEPRRECMGKRLYVGSLPFETTEGELQEAFSACGTVESVKIITDRDTGRSKGFGFVEMTTDLEAQAAIQKMNGSSLGSRQIVVNEARPQEDRKKGDGFKPRRPGGFGNRGGGGGGFGGGFGGGRREGGSGGNRWDGGGGGGGSRDGGPGSNRRDRKPGGGGGRDDGFGWPSNPFGRATRRDGNRGGNRKKPNEGFQKRWP